MYHTIRVWATMDIVNYPTEYKSESDLLMHQFESRVHTTDVNLTFPVICSISLAVASLTALALLTDPLTMTVVTYMRGRCLKVMVTLYNCCRDSTAGEELSGAGWRRPVIGISNMNTSGSRSCRNKHNHMVVRYTVANMMKLL